jgi:hypothetical protein
MDWGLPGELRYMQMFAVASLIIVPLACGALLWYGSPWLATRVSIETHATVADPAALDSSQLFAVGTSLLGLIVIILVLPDLANWAAFAIAARYVPGGGEQIDTSLQLQRWVFLQAGIARGVSLLARLVVGVVLLLGPGRVWRDLRGYAQRVHRNSAPDDEQAE